MNEGGSKVLNSKDEFVWPYPPEQTFPEYLLRKISEYVRNGRKECITNSTTNETLTYDDLERYSRNVASGLFKRGLRKGDTVIQSSQDAAKIHAFIFGVWRANGIVRSSYREDCEGELIIRVKESKAKFILCDKKFARQTVEAASQASWPITVVVFDGESEGCVSVETFFGDDGTECPSLEVQPLDAALILATSGTTGNSKGAVHSHKSLLESILCYENLPFTDKLEQPLVITSKQTHFVGCVAAFACIAAGRRLVMMTEVTAEGIFHAISQFKARGLLGFPKYLIALIRDPLAKKYDLSSLSFITSTGQLMLPEHFHTVSELPSLKSFALLYGMSENGHLTSNTDWAALAEGRITALKEFRPFCVGQLSTRTSLKVVSMETGELLGPQEKGELFFKSPFVCAGYLHLPKETAETFEDGWIRTGDIGYYDKDGFIYIVDRAKEIIKCDGSNHVNPSELENILLGHPAVAEAICCGIPDPVGGDFLARGFVVLKENCSASSEEIQQFYESKVPSYKRLRGGLYILKELPVGKTGKVTRKTMADLSLADLEKTKQI